MKTLITIITASAIVVVSLGFTLRDPKPEQDGPMYVTVSYTSSSNRVYTHWGGGVVDENRFKESFLGNEEYRNKIVEVLNALHEKGYEIIATNHFSYRLTRGTDEKEYNYTLKKVNSNPTP